MELQSGAEWGRLRRKSSDSLACDRRRTGPLGAAIAGPSGGDEGRQLRQRRSRVLRPRAPGLAGQRTGCAALCSRTG